MSLRRGVCDKLVKSFAMRNVVENLARYFFLRPACIRVVECAACFVSRPIYLLTSAIAHVQRTKTAQTYN